MENTIEIGAMLERSNIVHRDIKAENLIYIAKDFSLKAADFGISYEKILDK